MTETKGSDLTLNDAPDKRHWLPRGAPIITPERELKGDVTIDRDEDGNIRYVQRHLTTILNELHRRGTLDGQHVHDGQTYEVWQTIFRSRLGYRNNAIYQMDLTGMRRMVSEDELQVDDFGKLIQKLHQLDQGYCRLVETAIYEHITPRTLHLIEGNSVQFRKAFDALSTVMDKLREEWRRRHEEQDK
jgi:hypothetical protein